MSILKNTSLLLFAILANFSLEAQRNVRDSLLTAPHLSFNYAYQIPQGDMANRFGNNSNIGFLFGIKNKKNWYYSIHGTVIFGNSVSEPGFLGNLLTDNGEILDNQGQISEIIIQERGWTLSLEGGKLFPWIGPNENSGILFKGGVGFMQHKIRVEHQLNTITQLEGDYLKGYDRLTNGLMLTQFVGYYHMSDSRLLNFYVGFEAMEGLTEGRRDFNFDTETTNEGARQDILLGIRIGWVLNLYERSQDSYYFD